MSSTAISIETFISQLDQLVADATQSFSAAADTEALELGELSFLAPKVES